MTVCSQGEILWISVEEIGERYHRYRLPDAAAEAAMIGSLARHGQVSPVVVCQREETPEMLDGFKRLSAARALPGVTSLEARLLDVDEPTAKVTILGLNGTGRRMKELEEAWIVNCRAIVGDNSVGTRGRAVAGGGGGTPKRRSSRHSSASRSNLRERLLEYFETLRVPLSAAELDAVLSQAEKQRWSPLE
jgi:hypothetical protein